MLTRQRSGISPSLILPPDVHVDPAHRVGALLNGAWAPAHTARNLVRGVPAFMPAASDSTAVLSPGHGLAATLTTVRTNLSSGPIAHSPTYPLIAVYVGQFGSTGGTGSGVVGMVDAAGSTPSGSSFVIVGGSSTAVFAILRNNFSPTLSLGRVVPGGTAIGVPLVVVWQSLSATNHRLCVNGSSVATDTTNTGSMVAWSRALLGNASANNHSTAFFGFGFGRGHPLSDSEMQALSADPANVWGMLRRSQRRVWVPVGAGTVNALVLNSSGQLIHNPAAGPSDRKLFLAAGQLLAKTTASPGDRLLTLSGSSWQAAAPAP